MAALRHLVDALPGRRREGDGAAGRKAMIAKKRTYLVTQSYIVIATPLGRVLSVPIPPR